MSRRIGIFNALFALRSPRAAGAACSAGRSLAPGSELAAAPGSSGPQAVLSPGVMLCQRTD